MRLSKINPINSRIGGSKALRVGADAPNGKKKLRMNMNISSILNLPFMFLKICKNTPNKRKIMESPLNSRNILHHHNSYLLKVGERNIVFATSQNPNSKK